MLALRHSALYSQFIALYFILQMQDKYYIHQDISRKNFKKLFTLAIANVKNSLKQCNGSVIIPNGPVNSEVNLSMYHRRWPSYGRNICRVN
jgi:spore germination protein GerM